MTVNHQVREQAGFQKDWASLKIQHTWLHFYLLKRKQLIIASLKLTLSLNRQKDCYVAAINEELDKSVDLREAVDSNRHRSDVAASDAIL